MTRSYAFVVLAILIFVIAPSTLAQDDGKLPRSTPEEQGISSADISRFIETADREIDVMNSFMLVRHGHVIAEAWWHPYAPEKPHMLFSLSKSFTSTAVGLAAAEGKLSIHDPVLSFFPRESPVEPPANLRAMRVHDLLRMATGHESEPVALGGGLAIQTFLAHPVPFKPGTHFLYNTPATYMLSAIVQRATGEKVHEYLRTRLYEPLGIEGPRWGESEEGVTLGGYGLSVRTEDIAKLGLLYLQNGRWGEEQLLPEVWTKAATSLQTSNGSHPDSDWDQGYGYQFWQSRFGNYRGDGAFGQYCIVMPEHNAVVAIMSGVRDMQAVMNLVWQILQPAMQSGPLSPDVAAHEALGRLAANVRVPTVIGEKLSARAREVSGTTYRFPTNDRGIEWIRFEFEASGSALMVGTAEGEDRFDVGHDVWEGGRSTFVNGVGALMAPGPKEVAASGAWTAPDVWTVRLVLPETPFYTTMQFRFDGAMVELASEHNVAFGPTTQPPLTGASELAD